MLYKFRHMPGDMVLNPYLCLPKTHPQFRLGTGTAHQPFH